MSTKQEKIADLKQRGYAWAIPWDAVELIATSEDCQLVAYLCPAKKWTIGWGETDGVSPGMVWTKEQADQRLFSEVGAYATQVRAMCTIYTTDNQFGALVCFAYNVGFDSFKKSTVLKAHNAGDTNAAARAFNLWNKATVNGKLVVLDGLTSRRAEEAALYLRAPEQPFPQAMPQAVAKESSMAASPTNVAGAASISVGGLTVLSGLADQVSPLLAKIKDVADSLGINALYLVGGAVIAIGAVTIYNRVKQRMQGWA